MAWCERQAGLVALAGQSPSLQGTETPSPPPSPAAAPTRIVVGRERRSGRLINGFLARGRDDPPPECIAMVTVPGPPILYGLSLPPDQYSLHSVEPGILAGTFTVAYAPAGEPNAGYPAILVTLQPTYGRPAPLPVLDADYAVPAPSFLSPGVAVLNVPGALSGCWLGAGGLYCIGIETQFSDLTLEEAARRLVLVPYPFPGPPDTGNRPAGHGERSTLPAGGLVVVGSLLMLAGGLARQRRSGRM